MNEQLIFKFPTTKTYSKEDFYVSSSNQEAYTVIDSWPKWIKRDINVYGPQGSGKTHLMSILCKKTTCVKIQAKALSDQIFFRFRSKEVIIIEDCDEHVPEKILYSLYNVAVQQNKYILITSSLPLTEYKFKLPDLNSRTRATSVIEIKLPTEDLMNIILSKNFSDRQISVDKKHINYIVKRIDRSYDKISRFISILDNHSLKKGKSFSFKIIKEVLEMLKI